MTDKKRNNQSKLSFEILGLIGISAFISAVLFLILILTGTAIVESYCYKNGIILSELDLLSVDRWVYGLGAILSAFGFSVLIIILLNDRLSYIRTITAGINALRLGTDDSPLPLEGKNELTQLADAINYMSASQKELREKELALADEKEQFIRALSHDIRTPLTSILAYSEYLTTQESLSPAEKKEHLQMIRRKAEQIRDLTGLLLDSDKRSPQFFDDARLLMEQLAAEFEEELEEDFNIQTDLSRCASFGGSFDVQELRRIFDNLSSNVQKYADPRCPVTLSISTDNKKLCIRQTNAVAPLTDKKDSYRLGINSIRRIAQSYNGKVDVLQNEELFSISVMLFDF